MSDPAIAGQMALLHPAQPGLERLECPIEICLILTAPSAPVQMGFPIGPEQRNQVFSHDRCTGNSTGHGDIESVSKRLLTSHDLNPVRDDCDSLSQAEAAAHRFHGCRLASDGINQRHPGPWQCNGHSQAGEATAGAHINAFTSAVGGCELRCERPDTVEHLVHPVIVSIHKPGEIDPAVPVPQQELKVIELIPLVGVGLPPQPIPKV